MKQTKFPDIASTSSNTTASASSSTNTGAIAGGAVGGVAGLALVALAGFFLYRRRQKKQNYNYTAAAQGTSMEDMYKNAQGDEDLPPGYTEGGKKDPHGNWAAEMDGRPAPVQEAGGEEVERVPSEARGETVKQRPELRLELPATPVSR